MTNDQWPTNSVCSPRQAAARLAAGQWGVVSTAELFACGFDKDSIRVRVRQGHLHPLHRGVYAVGPHEHPDRGALARGGEGVRMRRGALRTTRAACLHCLLKWDGRRIDVTAPTSARARSSGRIAATHDRAGGLPTDPGHASAAHDRRPRRRPRTRRPSRARCGRRKFSERELALLPRGGMIGRILNLSAAPTRSHPEDFVLNLILESGLQHPRRERAAAASPDGRRSPTCAGPSSA